MVVLAAIAVIATSIAFLIAFVVYDRRVEQRTSGLRPPQFAGQLDDDLLDDYAGVFGVAHNSGDTVRATIQALVHGADVVEIDVIAIDGRLYAGHGVPTRVLGWSAFRGPLLRDIWVVAASADAIQLDLKSSSSGYLNLVLRFLAERQGGAGVVVSSSDAAALRVFADKAPEALRLLSVGSQSRLTSLQADPDLIALIDGVAIREDLLDDETMAWLDERQLLVFAWTVNDIARVNDLVALGVDAITTDSLAILELLGGQQRGERRLARPSVATPDDPAENQGGNET
jgi:hypothetical protein